MLKVMIVDNEEAIRRGLAHCIRWENLGCLMAGQAEDGIDALEQIPIVDPDIIITDIRMPGMDGLELAKYLCRDYPGIKIILLTGFPDFEYAQRAIDYQVVDFVLKPTTVEDLTQALERAKEHIRQEHSSEILIRELEDQSLENQTLQRSLLFHDLINRVTLSNLYVVNRMAQLGLNLTSYYMLRMDIDAKDLKDEEGAMVLLSQAQKILADSLSEYNVFFVPQGEQMCYAVVCAPETRLLPEHCEETVSVLSKLLGISVSIGLSRHYTDPFGMADAADEANQAVQFVSYTRDQSVVDFSTMPPVTKDMMDRILTDLNYLQVAFENRSQDGVCAIITSLFDFIRKKRVPVDEVRNICLYIHQFCTSQMLYGEGQWIARRNHFDFPLRIKNCSVDKMEKMLSDFVTLIMEDAGADDMGGDSIISIVKSHIDQHYREDLSLESLAGMVYLSPSYLSKLFKRKTGKNISAYIQGMRIEAAKALLHTTDLKTYEVAERVGIGDAVYFSRIFKKVTGVKPKDFRRVKQL